MDTILRNRLKLLVQSCLELNLPKSAIFYADKQYALSKDPDSCYMLAKVIVLAVTRMHMGTILTPLIFTPLMQSYFYGKQHRRALDLLKRSGERSPSIKCLISQCLSELKEWDECLESLNDDDSSLDPSLASIHYPYSTMSHHLTGPSTLSPSSPATPPGASISPIALLSHQKGVALSAQENRQLAAECFKQALLIDPYLYESFSALVDGHLMTNAEEVALVSDLTPHMDKDDGWLVAIYRCKLKKYEGLDEIESHLEDLERPLPSHPVPSGSSTQGVFLTSIPYSPLHHHQYQTQVMDIGMTLPQPSSIKMTPNGQLGQLGELGTMRGEAMMTDTLPAPSPAAFSGFSTGSPMATTPVAFKGAAKQNADSSRKHSMLTHQTPLPPHHPDDRMEEDQGAQDPHFQTHQDPCTLTSNMAAMRGFGMGSSSDVIACHADLLYSRGAYDSCYRLTSSLIRELGTSAAFDCLPQHVGSALQLGKSDDLFSLGHRLTEEHPDSALSWHSVACYYMASGQYEQARKYFAKATAMDPGFAPAWTGYGNAFSSLDERDQSLSAYRTAARLFPGLHQPLLGMGMEYAQSGNLELAERVLLSAFKLCPVDPAVSYELGALAYKNRLYAASIVWLRSSIDMIKAPGVDKGVLEHFLFSSECPSLMVPALMALGHSLRKLKDYRASIDCYHQALDIEPRQAGAHSAIGYSRHLMGSFDLAIESYHTALSLNSEDDLAGEMLSRAIHESAKII